MQHCTIIQMPQLTNFHHSYNHVIGRRVTHTMNEGGGPTRTQMTWWTSRCPFLRTVTADPECCIGAYDDGIVDMSRSKISTAVLTCRLRAIARELRRVVAYNCS
jgi:hypothetical protein